MPRLLRRLRSAARLPRADVGRAAEAAVLFHAFRLALRVVPFRRFQRVLGASGPVVSTPQASGRAPSPAAIAVSQALYRASNPYRDTCLPQALAGRVMLRRRGIPSTLSLGTRRTDDGLAFHAWIATEGVILNVGGGPRQFATIATFYDPPAAAASAGESSGDAPF